MAKQKLETTEVTGGTPDPTPAPRKWTYKKGDIIRTGGRNHKCLLADREYACFGWLTKLREVEQIVVMNQLFVLENDKPANQVQRLVKYDKLGRPVFES